MNSLLDKAIKLSELAGAADDSPSKKDVSASADDEELRKLVESMRIRISIIGCGGGGSNTINRLTQAGVAGAVLLLIVTLGIF